MSLRDRDGFRFSKFWRVRCQVARFLGGMSDLFLIQMLRLVTDDVVNVIFYHDPGVTAFRAPLAGPQVGVPDHLLGWNVYEWTLG